MPRATNPPKNVGQLIDQIERIREVHTREDKAQLP